MMDNSKGGFDRDEEKTLPPLTEAATVHEGRKWASAGGDFRTHETTFFARRGDHVVEVRLTSDRGDVAHFAFDIEVARRLAGELDGQFADPYFTQRSLTSRTAQPRRAALRNSGTDVFFPIEESPTMKIEREPGGDRIVLSLHSGEALLCITMQFGVALALQECLSGAVLRGGR